MNRKHTQSIYLQVGLTVRKRRGRKKAVGTRAPILIEAIPNARWSVEFVHDHLVTRQRLRIFNLVDDVSKECLGALVYTSISGTRVARHLTEVIAWCCRPR